MHEEGVICAAAMNSILQSTDEFIFIKDKNFVYVGVSESFAADCAGHTCVGDIIGKNDFQIFENQEIAQKYRNDDERLFETRELKMEYREEYPDKNGRKRYCLTTKYLITDESGNPAGILGFCHDITEQVELEKNSLNDINRKISDALNSVYFASNYVNLQEHTFVILQGTDYSKKMLEGCNDIETAFREFIRVLVKPEFVKKMQEFCDADTIAKRLKNEKRIDCEYLSKVAVDWCRASFIPVDYDESGNVIHALFLISRVDSVKAKEIEEGISNKKDLEAIFAKVPGGIVMYEWNGEKLSTLNISDFYSKQYGYSMENNAGPDFERVHPDDIKEYKKAIREALEKTHKLEYVYRVWNREKKRYTWTQINAVSEEIEDGKSHVYAMYSDVTKQKDAELLLKKRSASLASALSISNQLCYEYDPKLHTEECLTEDDVFHLPKVVENYPESILDLVHPDDQEMFLHTIHSMDSGRKEASCNIRLRIGEKYVWYAYQLHSIYDYEKERIIVLLSIMDNSEHVARIQDYEERMRTLLSVGDASLTLGTMNVTQNTFSVVYARKEIKSMIADAENFDAVFDRTVKKVVGIEEKSTYRKLFSRENLLQLAEQGQMNVHMDHMYWVGDNHLEWVRTCIDMLKNPQTGDVTGVCYAKSIQEDKIKDFILRKMLLADYPVVAVIYEHSGEFYLFDAAKKKYCVHMDDYWNVALMPNYSKMKDYDKLQPFLKRDFVLDNLKTKDEYVCTFYSDFLGDERRIELRYSYLDRSNGIIMLSLRNITDDMLLKQYKHDSEHDLTTGLLNRQALFRKCRRLLNEHPDQQFAMLHGDVKNFHLYNTFFGEDKGDKLLRDIADKLRQMDKDYDYWAYGRIEADVFCAFFPYDVKVLSKHVDFLLNEIARPHNDFLLEPNIGIYMVSNPSMQIEAMFSRATIAAKSNTNNLFGSISKYDEKMEQVLNDNQQIIREMQKAIDEEQFQVYLQPKYSLRTEEIVGAEALVRWLHPERGMVSPGRFIPLFESNGFIVKLDHYMWEHVCILLSKWKKEGKPLFPISVNVSRVSMYSQGTVSFIKELVEKYEIEPKYLELELTETAYMDDPEEIKIQLKELQDFGFHILMDDFGSGYSSLNTLRELPVDVLKLDMKFLSESTKDLRGSVVLSSVVRMSKLLSLPIVAEGVETVEQAAYLRSIGCEYVQGYFFAKPMPVLEYEKKLSMVVTYDSQPNQDMEKIYKHIVVPTNSLGTVSPIPTGFVEYENRMFTFLRLNDQFLNEFDLNKNLEPVSDIFKMHLDDKNYLILQDAFSQCVQTRSPVTFRFKWNADTQDERVYSGKVLYEGNVGNLSNMVVAFMNITEFDFSE